MIDIRPANPADADALAGLRWEFRAGRQPPTEDRDAFVTRCAAWMRDALAGDWRAWVAIDAGQIVGHVWLGTIAKVPNPVGQQERHAYISNVFVRPEARGGVGTRLMNEAMKWAEANSVHYAMLTPTERSRTLYARHGFAVSDDWLFRKF